MFSKFQNKFFLILGLLMISLTMMTAENDRVKELSNHEQIQFIAAMADTLSSVNTLKTSFIQERHLDLFMDKLVSKGYCFFDEPDRLRWEITESYRSILIYNQKKVAKFDFEDGHLRKLNHGETDIIREVLQQVLFWMKGDFSESSKVYDISIFQEEDFKLILRPKSVELLKYISSIELGIDKGLKLVKSVTINESSNDYIKIIFQKEEYNRIFNSKLFDLNKPYLINSETGK